MLAGAVAYYGGQIGAHLAHPPRVPALLHFGAQDASIPIGVVAEATQRDMPQLSTHVYAAGHGFNCEERPSFEPECAALAWRRTLGFLAAVT